MAHTSSNLMAREDGTRSGHPSAAWLQYGTDIHRHHQCPMSPPFPLSQDGEAGIEKTSRMRRTFHETRKLMQKSTFEIAFQKVS